MGKPIFFFSRNRAYSWLSNFAPYGFEEDGIAWPTVEHYFQAHKFHDPEYRERIRQASSPHAAKRLGQSRTVKIRDDWDKVKEEIMLRALRLKFGNLELREKLVHTGRRELIEKSPHDSYWGCGRNGKGKNRLGELLMQLREEVAAGEKE